MSLDYDLGTITTTTLYNLPIKIKCEKNIFLKKEFSDKSIIKNLSNHQLQEAKVTDDRYNRSSVATLVQR